MKRLLPVLAAVALVAGLSRPVGAEQQTFWQTSSGTAPSPWPTPAYWPVNWYGALYYPVFWPVCSTAANHHCRPVHAHTWPPDVPKGQHPVPMPAKPPH